MGWVRGLAALLVAFHFSAGMWTMAASAADSAGTVAAADDHGHGASHASDAHGADAGHGAPNPVSLDPDLAIVTAIIFLVLLAVLGKFAWKPVVEALDHREHSLADQLAEAKRNQEASRQLLADHEKRLAGAALEVKQMLDQAKSEAENQKVQILEAAQAAATAEKDRAVREIHAARNAALQDLANKSVETAVYLAGKIVRRQLSNEDHAQLVGDALQRFTGTN